MGVGGALIPGYGPDRWVRQSELLAQSKADFVLWGGFGLHPWAIPPAQPLPALLEQLEHGWRQHTPGWGQMLRAVGECGLDRSDRMVEVPLELQQAVLAWHLEKARSSGLPVILHLVRADGPALQQLSEQAPWRGVVHGFSSHPQTVPAYLAAGLCLSYGSGLLVSEKIRQALRATPLDRLMFETDGPVGWRVRLPAGEVAGPARLLEIAQAASQVLGKSVEYLLARHRENCREVFRLDAA